MYRWIKYILELIFTFRYSESDLVQTYQGWLVKETVSVISNNPSFKDGTAWFPKVPLKPLWNILSFFLGFICFHAVEMR